ncbi:MULTISPECIES: ABC transporter permease [unclassified Tenacibaculum]|uniref:ABC transporter permease n=1 Tax=unclassified Tenacibaculum TaxID=2635139 RepID=UPI001F1800BD|nr:MULTISPECIES: ABC transporter permease [unclassified Tenacibaculum]MCF2875767.1 ABC transporter permease [Tenacibaculum sp. Cn5-1]MCF2935843.1 ABC transporter permease [Tenacibaculum sp. Cn5-34]MCG7512403.1 ABC transporter permease [Tenacibaculum sp. Cn5-46]
MNIWKISIENIKSKPLYTILSVFSLALSIVLLLGTQQLKSSFEFQRKNNLGKIDLVIGAKGSPLQLVLASVLHVDNPTGNILFREVKQITNSPLIKKAVPISYGDNYKGYRIVGTTNEFTTLYNAGLAKGAQIKNTFEVILGATVAEKLDLDIGDTFLSSHGLIENDIESHDEKYTIVGVLEQTDKVIDRLLLTSLESIWDAHDHGNEHHEHEEIEEDKEITSLLVSFKNPTAFLTFPRKINKQTNLQAALPVYELDRLYEYTGIGLKTITWIAYLILILSGITIFISLYKIIKERAFDLALFRSFGATIYQLIKIVAYEGFIILLLAFVLALIILKIGLEYVFKSIFHQDIIKELSFQEISNIGLLVFLFIIMAITLAIYPIVKMNISTILSNEK